MQNYFLLPFFLNFHFYVVIASYQDIDLKLFIF